MNNRIPNSSYGRKGGCLAILGIVFLVMLVVAGIAIFFTVRWVHKQVETYTSTSPVTLPKSTLTDAQYAQVQDRITQFTDALNQNKATDPLVLNEQELNAYLEHTKPDGLGKEVYIVLDGSHIKSEASFPLDSLNISWVKGRYLNGNVTLDVSLQNHVLDVTAQQIEVNGLSPPESFMQGFRSQNLAKDATKDPKNAASIAKFESIQVQDSKLIVKAQAPTTP